MGLQREKRAPSSLFLTLSLIRPDCKFNSRKKAERLVSIDFDGTFTSQVWIMMDNLSFAWRKGFGMEFLLGENYSGGSISQIACDGDLSDEITYFD